MISVVDCTVLCAEISASLSSSAELDFDLRAYFSLKPARFDRHTPPGRELFIEVEEQSTMSMEERKMRFCFIVENEYRRESMPTVIARQLLHWGHDVDILEPSKTVTSLCDLRRNFYDAYVLKTVSEGPGLCILEAAEALGIPTINNPRSIRLVRDKTLCAAYAYAHGLPFPRSYFVVDPRLLRKIPPEDYPIVLKPTNGSSGRGLRLVNTPTQLATLKTCRPSLCFFLAQRYVENPGHDIKLYVIGRDVFAVARESPLHPEVEVANRLLPLKSEWLRLARRAGEVFGLDIYGVDLLETPNGPVIVDVNDFPSFEQVPRAVDRISDYIVHLAKEAKVKRLRQLPDRLALLPTSTETSATANVRNGAALSVGLAPVSSARPTRTRAGKSILVHKAVELMDESGCPIAETATDAAIEVFASRSGELLARMKSVNLEHIGNLVSSFVSCAQAIGCSVDMHLEIHVGTLQLRDSESPVLKGGQGPQLVERGVA